MIAVDGSGTLMEAIEAATDGVIEGGHGDLIGQIDARRIGDDARANAE